jgi:hypothetical protein
MFSDKMNYALAFLRSAGNLMYSAIRHPMETVVIERETGHVFKRFGSWKEYLERESDFPYSQYIVAAGIRNIPKPKTLSIL